MNLVNRLIALSFIFLYSIVSECAVDDLKTDLEYSINLMWVNQALKPSQKYIYPAYNEQDLEEKFLTNIKKWAALIQSGSVNLWYDGYLTSPSAVEETKKIFEQEALHHPQWAMVYFKDIRDFPEVKENPEVFSEKTPVYFRVDLLKVISAYRSLDPEKKHYFVFADLDMKPLSKEDLFDKKTQEKLVQYGIVLARGGWRGFENSFQIIGSQKPNLLKAIKTAIIDLGIERANRILKGGNWEYKRSGDTGPLEQSVYDSYPNMLHYFYHLEGWGKLSKVDEYGILLFGLDRIASPVFEPESDIIKVDKQRFNRFTGKEEKIEKVKIPTKIVEIPPSHFGGCPTQFDPDKISLKNFKQKLAESLEGEGKFNNALLHIVARNNYTKDAEQIADKLHPAELTKAFVSQNSKYDVRDCLSPLDVAIEEGHSEILKIIIDKLAAMHY